MENRISHLRVFLTPDDYYDNSWELRVEILVNGESHNFIATIPRNDFESLFDLMMEQAKYTIRQLVKEYETSD